MNPQFPQASRRSFVKKSLAAGIAASQPMFLAGLIRASGEGVGTGTKTSTDTTDPYTTFYNETTAPYGFDTTNNETTLPETTIVPTVPNTTFYQYY